ncbi:hypothetical protein [Microlunatus sp. GCM10028923]|uniref:hypothetical protein n=1 Tax=Microlunatus sp. GCM10028923 TaxID=3273400 RepID=UPI0036138988
MPDPSYFLFQGVFLLPALFGVILLAALARGAARVLGVIGCVVLLVSRIGSAVWTFLIPRFQYEFGYSLATLVIPSVAFNLISAAGLTLVVCAVVAGRRPAPA